MPRALTIALTLSACGPTPIPMACNGHESLCDRTLDDVTLVRTHNSHASDDLGYTVLSHNHRHAIPLQLAGGANPEDLNCDAGDPVHNGLLFLPTLAATQSMYPADVCASLERAGFKVLVSALSKSAAWPLCEQKRDLILRGRKVIRALETIRLLLQTGGQAWTDAERAKIADLNWRIVAEKQ